MQADRVILGVVGLALLAAGCANQAARAEESRSLRVGTLNTGLGDFAADVESWPERADALARLIREQDLDLLALQEMWSIDWELCDDELRRRLRVLRVSSDTSKVAILQERLPAGYTIRSEMIPSEDRRRAVAGLSWGLAVVTRLRVIDSELRRLSLGEVDRYPRIVQRLRWQRPGSSSPGSLFNVHLSGESHRSRMGAALEVLDFARGSPAGSRIVAGDLNSMPREGPLDVFLTEFRDLWDAARVKRVSWAGQPASSRGALFRMTEKARIDYLLADTSDVVGECTYRLDDPEAVALSDHPVVICGLD